MFSSASQKIYVVVALLIVNSPIGSSIAVHADRQGLALDSSMLHDFSDYVVSFGRSYQRGTDEYEHRQTVFQRNVRKIQAQNSLPAAIWTAGVNDLTDRTDDELKQLLGWRKAGTRRAGLALISKDAETVSTPPEVVDWTHLSMASDVPDQGSCGSCWAVATVSMLQGRYEAKMNGTRTFSAQQLVNCVPNPQECGGSGGCQGATVELAMDYISKMSLSNAEETKYVGKDNSCPSLMQLNSRDTRTQSFLATRDNENAGTEFGLQTWQTLPENKALPLMQAVSDGPVAISVAADSWFNYVTGVFDGCSQDAIINHAVTLFGYGEDSSTGKKFWKVRNSWGSNWGEKGYIRLYRRNSVEEDDEYCGTDTDPGAGIACKPYPESVRICGTCGLLYDSVTASLAMV